MPKYSRFPVLLLNQLPGIIALLAVLIVIGCNSTPPPIAVSLTPASPQNAAAGQVVAITAAVANDSTSKGVTWSLSGAGALSGQTATTVTYTAPAAIPSASTATVTATSVADATKTATFTINLVPISVSLSPSSPKTLEQTQTVGVTATVSNDPANKGVTWSLSGAGALSGQTATTVTYTAPASVTTASSPVITATSVSDNTKTAAFTINLVPPPSITTTTLPSGTVSTPYTTTTLAATGGVSPYTWTVTSAASTFPAGLTLSSAGAISGTPTAFGTFNFTVQVKDASNFTATANLSIKINPAPVNITTTALPNGIANASYSATLASTGGAPPITWSVTAGALPTGLVLAANGAITGTPTTAGTFSFTVQAADSSTPALTATKALSITVIPVLSITTSSLPNGITSTAYSATLASSGGVTPVAWSVTVGTLPAGLTLNASTGAISGTPTTAGTSNFTVQAADSGTPQQKVTKALSITIVQQLVITNSSLPTGAVNSVYSATLASSGGTPAVTWAITVGALPAGLNLNAATGAITGTPTAAGTSNFTVQATDSGTPQQTPTKAFSITVNPVLAITTTSMPSGTVGTAYNQTLLTNGGGIAPITWSITLGALPGGLTLNVNTGVISGTPTASGTFNFTVQAADSGTPQQTASKAMSISVATAPLSVATTGLPDGVVGQAYTGATLQSAGGNPPVTWSISVGSLPAGLTLNTATGAITGTPTTAGTSSFTVKATDSTTPTAQTATKQLSIRVNTVLTITSTSPLTPGTVNSPYSATLQSSGGATPVTWSITVGSLPAGLSLIPSTGVISGTPTASGTSNFTVQATDSTSPTAQTATANLSITVSVAPLVITSTSLQNGVVSSPYNQTLQFTGGTNPVTWSISVGSLPAGLTLTTATGAITGTPTTAGTSSFTVKATDSTTPTAQTATANLSITVNSAACGTGSETLLNGQYAFALQGFNGTNPVGIGGIFDADGLGHVAKTVGIVDINDGGPLGVQLNQAITSAGSSYSIGADHRGCMTIITGGVSRTFRFSLGNITTGVASTGHVIQFDASGEFVAGILRKQDPAGFSLAAINGNYAFGATAPKASSGKFAVVGTFTASGGAISAGQADTDDNGNVDQMGAAFTYPPTAFSFAGTYTIAANGRGTFTIAPPGTTVHANLYVVSASEMLMLSTDSQATNTLFVGSALQTTQSTFAANSLNAAAILYTTGLQTNGTTTVSRVQAGILTTNGTGSSFTFSGNSNKGGTIQAQSASGSYSVASNGRVTVTVAGPGANNLPIFYLVSPNKAFVLFTDSTLTNPHVEFGFLEPQTGGSFTSTSASGTYAFGTVWPSEINVSDDAGVATFAAPNINGTDDNISSGFSSPNNPFSGTFSIDSTGLGVMPSGCTIGTTCQTIFYVISPTKAVVFDVKTTNTNPNLQVADK